MAIVVFLIAAAVTTAPIFLTVIVSVASRREDRAWNLGARPRGQAEALARKIVDFRTETIWPHPRRGELPARDEAPREPACHR
ncbi:MAG TPA: hypothetical protein VFQ44_08635 [Streptosporangiaceae bacterium]|nr:hypothetical protein [Streptosporangiaceae bacterium]